MKSFFKALGDARYIASYLHDAVTADDYKTRIQALRDQGYI